MPIIVRYNRGFPTKLLKQRFTEELLTRYGQPIEVGPNYLVWRVYGLGYVQDVKHYVRLNPWNDGRTPVSVEVTSC